MNERERKMTPSTLTGDFLNKIQMRERQRQTDRQSKRYKERINEIEREEDDSINSNWRVLNKIQMTREHRGKEIQRKGYKEKDDSINSNWRV